jgi:hypothetical protein
LISNKVIHKKQPESQIKIEKLPKRKEEKINKKDEE